MRSSEILARPGCIDYGMKNIARMIMLLKRPSPGTAVKTRLPITLQPPLPSMTWAGRYKERPIS